MIYQMLKQGNRCAIDDNMLRISRNGKLTSVYVARADHHGPEFPFLIQCL